MESEERREVRMEEERRRGCAFLRACALSTVRNQGAALFFDLKLAVWLEAILEGEEEGAGTDAEVVFGAGEGAVGDVAVVAFVQEVVGGEREAEFAVDAPDGCDVKQDQVGAVSFGKAGVEMFGSKCEVENVGGDESCE